MRIQYFCWGIVLVSSCLIAYSASSRLIVAQGGKEALMIDATSENETVIAAPSRLIVQGVDFLQMWRQINETIQAQQQEIQRLRDRIPKISTFSYPGGIYTQTSVMTLFWNITYTPTSPNRTRLIEFTGKALLYTDNYSCELGITLASPAVGSAPAIDVYTFVGVCCSAQMEYAYPKMFLKDTRTGLPSNATLTYAVYTNVRVACAWQIDQPRLTQLNMKITEFLED